MGGQLPRTSIDTRLLLHLLLIRTQHFLRLKSQLLDHPLRLLYSLRGILLLFKNLCLYLYFAFTIRSASAAPLRLHYTLRTCQVVEFLRDFCLEIFCYEVFSKPKKKTGWTILLASVGYCHYLHIYVDIYDFVTIYIFTSVFILHFHHPLRLLRTLRRILLSFTVIRMCSLARMCSLTRMYSLARMCSLTRMCSFTVLLSFTHE
jgi:hypothetical protein